MKLALSLLTISLTLSAQTAPPRPKITGIAHISLSVHDVDRAKAYYQDFLGYREVFKLDNPDGSLFMSFIKVNDRQYIELAPEKTPGSDRLAHIALEVDDAEAMRVYLKSQGVKVPEKVGKGRIGNSNFNVTDPEGHRVEFVQYEPTGWTVRDNGKALDGPRISSRIMHLGISVGSLEATMKFYGGVLGFSETWRGSRTPDALNWVNMRLPNSQDYLEFMLYDRPPTVTTLHTMHHICLEVPDIDRAAAELDGRKKSANYRRVMEIKTGVNRKRQMNLFDDDGTRAEIMEPKTVDGKPTPSSSAPAPKVTIDTALFNGRNLDGWEVLGDGQWTVLADGTLLAQRVPNLRKLLVPGGPMKTPEQFKSWIDTQSWLYTKRNDFGEFDLHLEYWTKTSGNSGVSIRDISRAKDAITTPPNYKKTPSKIGYEIQINNRFPDPHPSGSIYGFVDAPIEAQKEDDWNAMDVISRKEKISIFLNGKLVAESPGDPQRSKTGPIGLQLHDQFSIIQFRNIRIKEL